MYMPKSNIYSRTDDRVWVKLSIIDTILLRIADCIATRIQIKYDRNRKFNYMGYDPKDFKKVKRLVVYYTNIPKP